MIAQWASALPPLVATALLLTLPGVLIGWALGLSRHLVLSTAPLLSVGALGAAVMVLPRLGIAWGPLSFVLFSAAVAALCAGLRRVLPRGSEGPVRPGPPAAPRWVWPVGAGLSGLVSFGVVTRAMGSPLNPQQHYDAYFHISAIHRVFSTGDPSIASVGRTAWAFDTPPPFYPPSFEDLGALVRGVGAADPVIASNVAALAIACVAWPLSVAALLRAVGPRSTAGVLLGFAAATTGPSMPYLLLSFGVLWPMELALSVLPAALALCWLAWRDRSPALAAAAVLGSAGIALAHPGGLFLLAVVLAALCAQLVATAAGAVCRSRGPVPAVAIVMGAAAVAVVGVRTVLGLPMVKAISRMDWPAPVSPGEATLQALTLGPESSRASELPTYAPLGAAALAAVGAAYLLARRRELTWLVGAQVLVGALFVVSAGIDSELSQLLTGPWYNDHYRLAAAIGLLSPVLVAWGAHALCRRVAEPRRLGVLVAALTVLVVALPLPSAWVHAKRVVAVGYDGSPGRRGFTPTEVATYRQIPQGRFTDRVIGDPHTGTPIAAAVSGHEAVYPHLNASLDPRRVLLAQRFRLLASDPAVCRAVEQMRVRYAVEDDSFERAGSAAGARRAYPGLHGLAGQPGLRLVARSGGTAVYEVLDCRESLRP